MNFSETTLPLSVSSIEAFTVSKRETNNANNKIREVIIQCILEDTIPYNFYEECSKWQELKQSTHDFIEKLVNHQPYDIIKVQPKGGRKYNYDFDFYIYYNKNLISTHRIELKFNTKSIRGCPQFLSIGGQKMKSCLSKPFDVYFYKNHLTNIFQHLGKPIPSLETYTTQIHQTSPECMREVKEKYKTDKSFCQICKQESAKAITNYIQETELNVNNLNSYLQETQRDKVYMMWYKGKFYMEEIKTTNYIIVSVVKTKNSYQCYTQTGKTLIVLLRWKNGNGVAYPALQISESSKKL